MLTNYIFPKMKYNKNETKHMYVFFDNGDYLDIKGVEIVDLSVKVYDKLIRRGRGFCPVVESGYFKFKICNKPAFTNLSHLLYNEHVFRKNRKEYIENRFIKEGGISEIWLFDENNWYKELICQAKAKMDGELLVLEFLPQPQLGSYSGDNNIVNIDPLNKKDISSIDLDFENCESFTVYEDEIKEMNLVFDQQLEWDAGEINRKVIGGYIKVKLEDKKYRCCSFLDEYKNIKLSQLEKRLCGKKGEGVIDICHLYVDYDHVGYGTRLNECIVINDFKTDKEFDYLEKLEDETGEDCCWFESGYSKKLKDGSIIIAFGIDAKETINKLS